MPSASDIFNQLIDANGHLVDIAGKLDALKGSTDTLVTLNIYLAQALYQNAQQNDTIICLLEKIAKNTCDLVNQSHSQTALQTGIDKHTAALAELYATTHPEAGLSREREERLRREIEKCCPPKPPVLPCHDKPCAAPQPIGPPPSVGVVIE